MILFNIDHLIKCETCPEIIEFFAAAERAGADGDFSGLNVRVSHIWQALVANHAGAKFISPEPKIAREVARLAEFYLFDSKILVYVSSLEQLELAAEYKADAAAVCERPSADIAGLLLA